MDKSTKTDKVVEKDTKTQQDKPQTQAKKPVQTTKAQPAKKDEKPIEAKVDNSALEQILKRITDLEDKVAQKDKTIQNQNDIITKLGNNNSNDEIVNLIKVLTNEKSKSGRVKVTYLGGDNQYMQVLSNGYKITFTEYGQCTTMSNEDALRFVNEYTNSFKTGKVVFDAEHLYLIEEKGIDTSKINYKPRESIERVHLLEEKELKDFYKSLTFPQREMLKVHIFNKVSKNEIHYLSDGQLRTLDKLSKGGYKFLRNKIASVEQY